MPGKVNESKWERAKKLARKQYGEPSSKRAKDKFYAVTSTIYKNLGGRFSKKTASVNGLQKLSDAVQDDAKWQPMTVGRAAKIVIPSVAAGAGLTWGVSSGLQALGKRFHKPWLEKGLRHTLMLGALADVPVSAYGVYQASKPPKPKRLGGDLIKVRAE